MADETVTSAEDRIDVVTRAVLGSERKGNLEALLKANRGLAARGLFVPAGTRLTVPDVDSTATVLPSINPWGD